MSLRVCAVLLTIGASLGPIQASEVDPLLEKIKRVGKEGVGSSEAQAAWRVLVRQGATGLMPTLRALNTATPEAANWLRSAIDAVAEKELAAGKRLPAADLEAFVRETRNEPRARRLAYEWLCRADARAPQRLLPGMLQDPSAELRRDAVAVAMGDARANFDLGDKAAAEQGYRKSLDAARDRDQVDEIAKQLKTLGVTVDLAAHFGFIKSWHVIGPFDSTGGKGHAAVYAPEKGLDLTAKVKGKNDIELGWKEHTTTHPYAQVDFNKVLGKHMGCVGYAIAVVNAESEQPAELRMESNNAVKVFLNGQLVYAHEEYHHGHKMDQYVARVTLKAGRNDILVKVCQNEQKEDWAQQWAFHLRVCDSVGTALKLK